MLDYNKNQPVVELYRAIQSEGSKNGIPHIILRTTGCTHRCWFGDGGWCDSWYTSIHPEKGKFTLHDISVFFEINKDINHLMLTGGSPTMHSELCDEIITLFKKIHSLQGYSFVTIETEGSHHVSTTIPIDLVSLSPKFRNSIPKLGIETPQGKIVDQKFIDQHNKFRLNKEEIRKMIAYHKDYQFKPVWDGTSECLEEIENFRTEMNIPKSKTWIMPAGDCKEEIIKMYPKTIEMCTKYGYCFSGRDHIIAFDKMRGV